MKQTSFQQGVKRTTVDSPKRLHWSDVQRQSTIRLYAGAVPEMKEYEGWTGLSIEVNDERHLLHDITTPIPLPDGSVDAFQAEDVFEHIQYDALVNVVNEIFRVLKPGGYFRLSIPDYRCSVLRDRSEKDRDGNIVFDPYGGGTIDDPGHVWFPVYESVKAIADKSRFADEGEVTFYHYYDEQGRGITHAIDYSKGIVRRTPDFDERVRAEYRPLSIVVDMVKNEAESASNEVRTEFHGTEYGGWAIVPEGLNDASIVYSFGIGEDISFDLSVIQKYGVNIFAFDPTPKSIRWLQAQALPEQFRWYEYGLANFNGSVKFYPPENPDHVSHTIAYRSSTAQRYIEVPVKTFSTVCRELGHSKIDILKMDIEGAEYSVIDDIVGSGIEITQILVEFHDRFEGFDASFSQRAISTLERNGYEITAISPTGNEYSFIKRKRHAKRAIPQMPQRADVPVVLIAYNRPEHTNEVLAALKHHGVQNLYVFCDAPKTERDREGVNATRKLVEAIDWTTPVVTYQTTNQGLARSIVLAADTVFEKYDRLILLEDDCVPQAYFFDFMHACLERYKDNERIFGISGYSVQVPEALREAYPYDLYFAPRIGSWGWATWKRAWKKKRNDLGALRAELIRRKIDIEQGGDDVPSMLDQMIKGTLKDVWTMSWILTVYLNKGYYIYPTESHVKNIGMDGSGVHCGATDKYDTLPAMRKPARFPFDILVDKSLYENFRSFYDQRPSAHNAAGRQAVRGVQTSAAAPGDVQPRRALKVVHLCMQDFGGAGTAAYRLHRGLLEIGVDSTMLVLDKKSKDPTVKVLPDSFAHPTSCRDLETHASAIMQRNWTRWSAIREKYPHRPDGLEIFSDIVTDVRLEMLREVQEADIINLHWVAGMLNYDCLPPLSRRKKIVWTLHDMNPFTGGCHYHTGCPLFASQCSACPQLGSSELADQAFKTMEEKRSVFAQTELHIVSPSKWLADCARQSSLFGNYHVDVIPYGFPLDVFTPDPSQSVRRRLGLQPQTKLITFVADYVGNTRKGIHYLFEALSSAALSQYRSRIVLGIVGNQSGEDLSRLPYRVHEFGPISDPRALAQVYSSSDVFVIPSLEDNLPNTVVEALASGTPVVGFDIGGIPDMIAHQETGYLARPADPESLAEGILWMIEHGDERVRARCRESAERRYALHMQAHAYNRLYRRLVPMTASRSALAAMITEAESAMERGEWPEAKERLCDILAVDSGHIDALNDLSVVELSMGNITEAVELITSVLEKEPLNEIAAGNLAFVQEQLQSTLSREADAKDYPKISVITPSFNQAQYIGATIESVLAQRYPNFEHIVVDGASTDGTTDVLKRYDHLTWISEKDNGQSDAINKGLRMADGEIIAWINSDDWYEPGAFHAVAEYFLAHPDENVVMGDCNLIDADGVKFDTVINHARGFEELSRWWIGRSIPTQPAIFFRKKLIDTVGVLDTSLYYTMDYDLWMRFARTSRFNRINRIVANYRFHRDAKIGDQNWEKMHPELKQVRARYCTQTDQLVSVVIACYNYAAYLPIAVQSVLDQTHTAFEIIIVNDGSTDNSLEVAKRLIAEHPEHDIRVYTTKNLGPTNARVEGMSHAKGEFLLVLDPDDKLAPDYMEETIRVLNDDPSLGYVYVDVQSFGDSTMLHRQYDYDFNRLLKENYLAYCSLIRRKAFEEVGGYDRKYWGGAEDWELWIILGSKGWHGKHLAKTLFFYNEHFQTSVTRSTARMYPYIKAYITSQFPALYSKAEYQAALETLKQMPPNWQSRPLRGIQNLKDMLKQSPDNQHLLFFLAGEYVNAGRYTEAFDCLSRLHRLYPHDEEANALILELNAKLEQRAVPVPAPPSAPAAAVNAAKAAKAEPDAPATTVFLLTIGDISFDACKQAIEAQQGSRFRLDIIRNISPFSAAAQEMINRCTTEFFIQVDEDMIMEPTAVAMMEEAMRRAPANVGMICFHLYDVDREQPIQGIKIYRTSLMRDIRFHDIKASEMNIIDQMKAKGVQWVLRNEIAGKHGTMYTPESIYLRYKSMYEKDIRTWNRYPWDLRKKLDKFLHTNDINQLFAVLGAAHGIINAPHAEDKEKDFTTYHSKALEVFRHLLIDTPAPDNEYDAPASVPASGAHTAAASEASARGKNVLIACTHFWPSVGGVEIIAENLGAHLVECGCTVDVATIEHPGRAASRYRGMGIISLANAMTAGKESVWKLQLRDLVASGRYDACILLSDPLTELIWSVEQIAIPARTRVIVQPIINVDDYASWRDDLKFRARLASLLGKVTAAVTLTRHGVDDQFMKAEGIAPVFLPNATDPLPVRSDFRKEHRISPDTFLVLHVANLYTVKNHVGLMRTLGSLPDDCRLVMIGYPTNDQECVRAFNEELKKHPRVLYIPGMSQEGIASAVKAADLLVLGSHGEVSPVCIMEAMSHRTAWLATPSCGTVNEQAGGIVTPIEHFPQVIAQLKNDRRLLAELADAGFRHWEACYSWKTVIRGWAELIAAGRLSASFAMPQDVARKMESLMAAVESTLPHPVPASTRPFRVVALISAYNEGDVIHHVIGDLIANNVDVYLLDNNSTDNTVEQASPWLGKGLLHIERFPDDCGYPARNKKEYVWRDILRRKEELAQSLEADWFIHADADEFRESPFPETTLSEGIRMADEAGFSAINFELVNFRPINDDFVPGTDVRRALRYYEKGEWFDSGQIKAWKKTNQRVDLVSTGGHSVGFAGRNVYPIPFILRHYPIRGERHGRNKVFQERLSRFAKEERAAGWHVQYDEFADAKKSFLYDERSLIVFDGEAYREELLNRAKKKIELYRSQFGGEAAQLEQALIINPYDAKLLKRLSDLYLAFELVDQALMLLERLAQALPGNAEVTRMIGILRSASAHGGQQTVQAPSQAPLVSIIIPVFNKVDLTRACIAALDRAAESEPCELIIVDNASTDGTKEYLKQLRASHRHLTVIENSTNLGFAKANNLGARAASGKYLLFLNNDTEPSKGWLGALLRAFEEEAGAGIVGAKLLYPNRTIQHAGIEFMKLEKPLTIDGYGVTPVVPDHPWRNEAETLPEANLRRRLDMVTGACLMIEAAVFTEVGGFDETYLNGCEDIDLCLKVRQTGRSVVYEPQAVVIHHEGQSEGRFAHVRKNLEHFFRTWGARFDDAWRFVPAAAEVKQTALPAIAWEGSQFVYHSLALINREMCTRLAADGAPLSVIPYEADTYTPEANDPARVLRSYINKAIGEPEIHVRLQWPPNLEPPRSGRWVINQPWEFGALPVEWVDVFTRSVDEMWVISSYVRECYIASGVPADRVFVVPCGFDPKKFNLAVKPAKLKTKKKFKFLFVGGTIYRKGIDLLVEAYTQAFTKKDDVCLVIKDMGGDSFYKGMTFKDKIAELRKAPDAPEIEYIDAMMTERKIAGLYAACDALVHPYRGEGFGLPILEAMACGVPAIVPNGGACLDFCSPANSLLIDAPKRVYAEKRVGDYDTAGNPWLLEPSLDDLKEKMLYAAAHSKEMRQLGRKAHDDAHASWTWDHAYEALRRRIMRLKDMPIRRFRQADSGHMLEEAERLLGESRITEAVDILSALRERDPENIHVLNDLAVAAIMRKEYPAAAEFLSQVIALDPVNELALDNLKYLQQELSVSLASTP